MIYAHIGHFFCHLELQEVEPMFNFSNATFAACLVVNGTGLVGTPLPIRVWNHHKTEVVFNTDDNMFTFYLNPVVYDVSPQMSFTA